MIEIICDSAELEDLVDEFNDTHSHVFIALKNYPGNIRQGNGRVKVAAITIHEEEIDFDTAKDVYKELQEAILFCRKNYLDGNILHI